MWIAGTLTENYVGTIDRSSPMDFAIYGGSSGLEEIKLKIDADGNLVTKSCISTVT